MKEKSNNEREQKKSTEKNKIKKPYRPPHLEIYGTLVGLTNGSGGINRDGGSLRSKA